MHLRDVALAGVGDLVEAVRAVDHEGPDRAQLGQQADEVATFVAQVAGTGQ